VDGDGFVSGDGFVTLADGSARWGRFGAAGLLVRHIDNERRPWYLLALRSRFCHQGGTWALPGGALHFGESPLDGALREFAEELGTTPHPLDVVTSHVDDHGGWSYTTVVVDVAERFDLPPAFSWETDDARWFASHELHTVDLFAPVRVTLTRLGFLAT
jgi:8-oxo-dGTP pyrophosphatase MutT (NUDIX family)